MPDQSADRNLLFGLLALQNSFVDQDDLLVAFREWTKDKAQSIEEVLRQRKVIGEEECNLLAALVRKHIERHGDSAERGLAALSSIGPVAASLRQFDDHALNASLGHISLSRAGYDPFATRPPTAEEQTIGPGVRFHRLRPHAKGGLGEVFVALDKELNREVALKEIQDHHADNLDSRTRFVIEAEITGGLEHPGIVPVYGLGQYADGRPFYAMRFIQGDSLADAIRRFHGLEGVALTPGERMLGLQKLLRRFLDVCNVMAYAHSRSVLHRDLKPGNIMVGKYGETLVVDWGLAKSVDHDDPVATEGERPLIPASGSGSAPTLAGTAIGTPEFMSPEQAVGDLAHLGPATDVYSLGATLYCLLTGKPPFERRADEAGHVGAMLGRVSKGDFSSPRKVDATIPAPLDAICLKAMALRPADRYATPRVLADDIERWLADEPVSAFREGWAGNLRRWARRHKAWTQAGATAVVLVAVVATVAAVLVDASRRKVAESLLKETEARTEAQTNFVMAREAVDDYLTKVSQNTLLKQQDRADLRGLRSELLVSALQYYNRFIEAHANDPNVRAEQANAYFRVGMITDEIGSKEEAIRFYTQAVTIQEKLADENPAVAEYRDLLTASFNNIANIQAATGRIKEALQAYEKALAIREKLTADNPADTHYRSDLSSSHNNIGALLQATGRKDEALLAYEKALKIREKLADENPAVAEYRYDVASSHNNLGVLLGEIGRKADAIKAHEKALAIQQKLTVENPTAASYRDDVASSYNNLAIILQATGRKDEAMQDYEKSLAIRKKLADENPSVTEYRKDIANSHDNIGLLLRATGRVDLALRAYEKAMAIREKLAAENPSVTEYRSDLAKSDNNIAILLSATGRNDEALRAHEKAVAIREKLVVEIPSVTEYRSSLAKSYNNIGAILHVMERYDEAIKAHEKARAIREKLVAENPSTTGYRSNLADSYNNIGAAFQLNRRYEPALRAHEKGVAIREKLAADNPSVTEYRSGLADGHNNIGALLLETGRHVEALAAHEKARAIREKLVAEEPAVPEYRSELANSYYNIGMLLAKIGKKDEALRVYEKAQAVWKKLTADNPSITEYRNNLAETYFNIGTITAEAGRKSEALQSHEEALTIWKKLATENPSVAEYQRNLAFARDAVSKLKSKTDK